MIATQCSNTGELKLRRRLRRRRRRLRGPAALDDVPHEEGEHEQHHGQREQRERHCVHEQRAAQRSGQPAWRRRIGCWVGGVGK